VALRSRPTENAGRIRCGVKKLDRERKPERLLGSVGARPQRSPDLIDEKRPGRHDRNSDELKIDENWHPLRPSARCS